MAEAERITRTPESGAESGAGAGPETEAETGTGSETERGSEGGAPVEPEQKAGRGKRRILALLLVAAVVYALDLSSKLFVVAKLEHHAPVEVIGTLLRFTVIRNRGAAFSMGEALTIFLTIIATVVIVVIARIARKLYSLPWAIALGLLLGGAFGNLTDRVFRSPGVFKGAVVDFIAPAHFAVFNLADSAIVCGGILIVILSFRGLDPDGTLHKD
ncbi:signal peptidase II [Streptomyces sp. NPDC101150]|uniref:signal peptidase II n=1 Tax=Streptomyces sp. NPDC101150 TaxID=3366114 RepID=UPI00381CB9AE